MIGEVKVTWKKLKTGGLLITIGGETRPAWEWAEKSDVPYDTFMHRFYRKSPNLLKTKSGPGRPRSMQTVSRTPKCIFSQIAS